MDNNYKGKFNVDHVYCHSNERPNYIRVNNAGFSPNNADMIRLIQENEQIKTMLFLHLELLEQQNDKLTTAQKVVLNLREENQALRLKIDRLERRMQQQKPNHNAKAEKKEATVKQSSPVLPVSVEDVKVEADAGLDGNAQQEEGSNSIIGESNGKLISKIVLHRIRLPSEAQNGSEPLPALDEGSSELQPSAPKIMKKGFEFKIESDESLSCDSLMVDERKHPKHASRRPFLSTKREYCIREWEDEQFADEFNKEEADALKSDEPMLEIPKWTTKELSGCYSIEGTEDLSDETFLKRHAKLEYDEKRRKKWDVQRIREQKNIERLKRRHCKDELQDLETPDIFSFFPSPDAVKYVQIVEDLPVQAFGEGIPLMTSSGFSLPWTQGSPSIRASERHCNAASNHFSSFVYLKKRRRQQNPTSASKRSSNRTHAITALATPPTPDPNGDTTITPNATVADATNTNNKI